MNSTAIPFKILPPRVQNILDTTANRHGLLVADIRSSSHRSELVRARREIIGRLREELQYSMPRIGRIMGLHHTSVCYALHSRPRQQSSAIPPKPVDWSVPDESGVWAI